MSGASSAFLNGHLSDRQRELVRRKDLDLAELLNLCAEPLGIDERVNLIQQYSKVYPELRMFLIVANFYKDSFKQLNELGPIQFELSKVPKGGSPENLRSMWYTVTQLYDEYASGPRIKRGKAYQLLTSLYKDDAVIISQLLQGKYYRKELNEIVVGKAFAIEVANSPKT